MSLRNHNWRKIVKALGRLGFTTKRQSGSHIILDLPDGRWTVTRHDPIKIGTLKSIVEDVGLPIEEFLKIL